MTPQKRRTYGERLAFADADLTTPVHDEIMLWLDKALLSLSVQRALTGHLNTWPSYQLESATAKAKSWVAGRRKRLSDDASRTEEWLENVAPKTSDSDYIAKKRQEASERRTQAEALEAWALPDPPPRPDPKLLRSIWEYPLGDDRFTAGFLDLYAEIKTNGIALAEPDVWVSDALPDWSIESWVERFAFEVKSSIPSLGELIRQIRFYETKISATFVVVSTDTRWLTPLVNQGIAFLGCGAQEPVKLTHASEDGPCEHVLSK